MRVRIATDGPVPAAEAWDRYVRPARWPEWSPYLLGVESSADRVCTGMTGRVRGPLGLAVPFEVTAHDEDARTWAWDAHFGPITLTLDHGVEDRGSGSRTWLTVEGPAPALALYLPLARISIELLVRRRP